MRKVLRGYAKDKNGNLILIGTTPVLFSKDKCSPATRDGKRHLVRQGAQNCGPESIRYKYRMIRLTDEQWERIRNHFPEEHIADGRPGRKPIPTRRVLEAVLWLLNTGAQWHMLPQSYPNYKTVHRRFQAWCRARRCRDRQRCDLCLHCVAADERASVRVAARPLSRPRKLGPPATGVHPQAIGGSNTGAVRSFRMRSVFMPVAAIVAPHSIPLDQQRTPSVAAISSGV